MALLPAQQPRLTDQGITQDTWIATLVVMLGLLVVWAVLAGVAAYLVWRGVGWARTALLVSAGVAGGGLLVAALAQPLIFLPFMTCVATAILLRRTEAQAWCGRRPGR